MWSRAGLRTTVSMDALTPHLFVYQPTEEEVTADYDATDGDTEPSDSGYADSTRSAGAASGSGSGTPPEAIYYTANELEVQRQQRKEKEAIRRLSNKFDQQRATYCANDSSGSDSETAGVASASLAPPTQLTDLEILRVETFFRGNRTEVFVGKSLANLYTRQAKSLVGLNRCSSQPDVCTRTLQRQTDTLTDWQLRYTGIPVVLLDTGATKSRTQRRIQVVLAERGTGFTLWRDTIDNLSNYEAAGPTFHTMRTSADHRQIAGLSFDSAEAAQQLYRYVETLTSDPANIRLSAPKNSRTSSFLRRLFPGGGGTKSKQSNKPIVMRKSDISQPCFFQHVTSVDSTDRGKFFTMQALVVPSHQ